jgi:hypothetical protein
VLREQREVRPLAVPEGSERMGLPRPDAHATPASYSPMAADLGESPGLVYTSRT